MELLGFRQIFRILRADGSNDQIHKDVCAVDGVISERLGFDVQASARCRRVYSSEVVSFVPEFEDDRPIPLPSGELNGSVPTVQVAEDMCSVPGGCERVNETVRRYCAPARSSVRCFSHLEGRCVFAG